MFKKIGVTIGNLLILAGLVLMTIGLWASISDAQEITKDVELTFAWDANSETDLAGYRLYDVSAPTDAIFDIPAGTETTIQTLSATEGEKCFHLTAYDTAGNESDPSNVACASFNFEPGSPVNLEVLVKIIISVN